MATILVAEDDRHISRVLELWVTRNGHEVLTCVNGDDALDLIRSKRPDLLITDVNMPGMNGMDLLRAAREESLLTHPAIILTSRCDQAEIELEAQQLGATLHPKPFSPQNMMAGIEAALASNWNPFEADASPKPQEVSNSE